MVTVDKWRYLDTIQRATQEGVSLNCTEFCSRGSLSALQAVLEIEARTLPHGLSGLRSYGASGNVVNESDDPIVE